MFDPSHLVSLMDIGYEGPQDISKFDMNGDNVLTAQDCPYAHGTLESKVWFSKVLEPYVKQQITEEMAAKYGDKVVGAYYGKPLVPGVEGSPSEPQGDFQYLVDKLISVIGYPQRVFFIPKISSRIRTSDEANWEILSTA